MSKKNMIIGSAIFVFIIVGFLWLRFPPQPEGLKTTGLPMTVARSYWPGSYWVEIAEKKGWFSRSRASCHLI